MRKLLGTTAALLGLALVAFGVSLIVRARTSRGAAPEVDAEAILDTGRLPPCPASPNCVSSQAPDPGHGVEPFELDPSRDAAPADELERLLELAQATGGEVVERSGAFVHLRFRTRWLGFVDDLYLLLAPQGTHIDVRSASRVGSSDLGANRTRVESLRRSFNDA